MVREMSGDGAEPQVGHLDDPVKVVGRIRHGQEQYLQCYFLRNPWLMKFGLAVANHQSITGYSIIGAER
jgi:hypothetical protein